MSLPTKYLLALLGVSLPVMAGKEPKARKHDDVQTCKNMFVKHAISFQKLWEKRPPELRDEHTDGLSRIAEMTPEHCTEPPTQKDLLGLVSRLLNAHSGRIVLLLPLSTKPYTRHIVRGMEAAIIDAGGLPSKVLITLDTQSKVLRTEQHIAQAIFSHEATAIIGGFESTDIEILRSWAPKLQIPTFILNKPPIDHKPIPYLYYTHPTPRGIAKALIGANERYRHKNISMMRPNDQHADDVARAYEQQAKSSGINILHSVIYDARRLDQMESAARKLFRLEPNDRLSELKDLYTKAKEHATQTNVAFNPKMIALQPVISQDAILILDQFRNVRHMAKVFSFLGVRRIPMFGHYEWRSIGLIEPFDPMFTGSYFVDVTGSYSSLPTGIRVPTLTSPNLIAPNKVEEVDLSALGYRAVEPALMLTNLTDSPRRKLDALIPKVEKTPQKSFAFDSDNVLVWPTYLFEVTSQGSSGSVVIRP